ncbi:hypothetical protein APA48_32130 [Pseudomonas aeruginosa]|nr:hypothetical protein APA48_32130 [Pseudomonas aeruginosa]OPE09310.1 hypothetical protein APA51_33325 [Pseudomonas aeruginosa]
MGSCAAPSAKGDDKFITTDYLQQCLDFCISRSVKQSATINHVKDNDVKLHSLLRRWFAFLDRSLIGGPHA